MTFDEWWDINEKQYSADSCHMSEYHMAHFVWKAAFKEGLEIERKKQITDFIFNKLKNLK